MARKAQPAVVTENGVFPSRLREVMCEKRVSQKALAEAIGKRPQTVSLYAAGQSLPDVEGLRLISQFLNVSADWLIGCPNSTKAISADIAVTAKTTGLSEKSIGILAENQCMRECNYFIENGHLEKMLECIHNYELSMLYLCDKKQKEKTSTEEARTINFPSIDTDDMVRRGFKADLVECALKITQSIDDECQQAFGLTSPNKEGANANAVDPKERK